MISREDVGRGSEIKCGNLSLDFTKDVSGDNRTRDFGVGGDNAKPATSADLGLRRAGAGGNQQERGAHVAARNMKASDLGIRRDQIHAARILASSKASLITHDDDRGVRIKNAVTIEDQTFVLEV